MEENKRKIVVVTEDGSEKEAEVLVAFTLKDTNKDYMLYTLNEVEDNGDGNGMVKIYATRLIEKDGMYEFEPIDTDEEWVKVKDAMKQMAKVGQENNQ